MLWIDHGRKYFPAGGSILLLSFVSLWYLTTASSQGYCDKDGCDEIGQKGIPLQFILKKILIK